MGYQQTILRPENQEEFNKLLNQVVLDQKKWYIEGIEAYSILNFKKNASHYFNKGEKCIVVGGERYPQWELEKTYSYINFEIIPIESLPYKKYLTDEYHKQLPVPYEKTNRELDIELFKEDFDNVSKEFKSEQDLEEYLNDFWFIYGSISDYLSEYHYDTLHEIGENPSASDIHKKIDVAKQHATIYTTKEDEHDFRTSKDLIISWKLVEKTDGNLTYLFTYKDKNLES